MCAFLFYINTIAKKEWTKGSYGSMVKVCIGFTPREAKVHEGSCSKTVQLGWEDGPIVQLNL